MPEACNYCDDIVAETADLTIGDAWLPQYSFDWRGKNMVISRNPSLTSILEAAEKNGYVALEKMTASDAADAQAGGFRQRREGLAHRMFKRKLEGLWVPEKRALPDIIRPKPLRAWIYDLREQASRHSHIEFRRALDSGQIEYYDDAMAAKFKRLRRVEIFVSSIRIIWVRLRALASRRVA